MDVLMEMTWSDDIRRKGSRLAVPHFVSCLAWLWHPAQLAAGQWDGPGVKHCAVRTTSGRYLTVISQSGVLQGASAVDTRAPAGYREGTHVAAEVTRDRATAASVGADRPGDPRPGLCARRPESVEHPERGRGRERP